ncbi:polysaccharide deacetylase [Youhaiella tibetensis]|uniref:Chitooligosaccharide deacetylase n=1 Tax=Paradevosia tibetensis TaxID=1447062 RepID=A0A5B9DML5_9HYPH|nr:polysaccharide deacetylase family protein [Youhaiella tibetensis]QEE20222.1 polysaccharide deacetylase family protein [Youhaiella tibetensis]GGF26033.1 polysaccharide deacetylase [Youhaiella tibetensis]
MRLLLALPFLVWSANAFAEPLREPRLNIASGGPEHPQVALTLDACMGGTDMRILSTLVDNAIPATVFVTARWLARNEAAVKVMLAHPELFELEDHGAEHVPAVLGTKPVYGIRPAGTLDAISAEVEGGQVALLHATGVKASWYRDATALYSPEAMSLVRHLDLKIAGYSLNGDQGASLSAASTAHRIAHAQDGDVIIAHINQPRRPAGGGVAAGILALKARGFSFVRLEDVVTFGADGDLAQR